MQYKNKFRNSDCNLRTLANIFEESPAKRMRTTLSNASIANLDFSYLRSTLANTPPTRPQSSIPTFQNQPHSLKEQLASIQQKLNQAKAQMHMNSTHSQKPTLKVSPQERKPICHTTVTLASSRSIYKQQPSDEPQLRRQISAMLRPRNIKLPSSNPYLTTMNSHYYVSEAIRAMHQKNSMATEHVTTSISILKQCFQALHQGQIPANNYQKIRLPKPTHLNIKKTLILDLDQTLIHCFDNSNCEADLTLKIVIEQTPVEIHFSIRPYAMSFLKKMSKKWQIIIFTASHQSYANAILDEIDPQKKYIQHRLYRQHCSVLADMYVKDLSLINRDLRHTVLVDNAAYSYCLQLDNGIPILPFYDGKDYQLSALQSYLDKLYYAADVREVNREYFNLQRYTDFDSSLELIKDLYVRSEEHS